MNKRFLLDKGGQTYRKFSFPNKIQQANMALQLWGLKEKKLYQGSYQYNVVMPSQNGSQFIVSKKSLSPWFLTFLQCQRFEKSRFQCTKCYQGMGGSPECPPNFLSVLSRYSVKAYGVFFYIFWPKQCVTNSIASGYMYADMHD